ncbi:PD-(D/E)XK nuclease family transposase [Clostridium sp. AF27-2AA]|uniref:PD-(D/E)XK nuclease family transposase n=1 Tax=Clostridium sp. AF27-2AA TaxID=2292206 RepID=UPI001FAAF2FD
MTKVFEDIQCAELLLRIILNDESINVLEVHSQRGIKNLQGRSVRLDILAIDSHGRVFNVEVQRSDKGAGAKRARYNSALIDANVTEPGDLYEALNETFVIFITENDVMKADLPIYHIDRVVKETGKLFKDEAHIIYVNSQIKDAFSENQRREKTFSTWGQWKNDPQHRNTNRNYSDYPSNHHHLNGRQYHSCPAKQGHRKPDGCGFEPGHTIF